MNVPKDLRKRVRSEDDVRGSHAGIFNQLSEYFPKHFVINGSEHTECSATSRKVQKRQRTLNHEFPVRKGQAFSPMHDFQGLLAVNANRPIVAFGFGEVRMDGGRR